MAGRWSFVIVGAVAVVGIILLIVGGALVAVFNDKINDEIKRFAGVDNGTEGFEAWKNWSHFEPIYRHFYFFHVQNPDDIVRTGRNISVKEVGPYVYRVNFKRRKIAYKDSRLSYELYKSYTFEPNLSEGLSEDDKITTLNLPFLNLATRLRFENETVQEAAARQIDRFDEGLFDRLSISDLLWGYYSKHLRSVLIYLDAFYGVHPINDSTYGLLYQREQPKKTTFEGSYEAEVSDIKSLWNIKEWNGKSSLGVWGNDASNAISGSDGYAWPPQVPAAEDQSIFDSQWCRSLRLTASAQQTEKIGNLSTFKYFYDNRTFSYSADGNKGFCQPTPMENRTCLDDGVLNITKCADNIPLLLSQPHFLGANPSYYDAIDGLHQNESLHTTTFNLEQHSGEVVEASRKIQLNAFVTDLKSFPDTKHFENSEAVIPVVWMEEVYSMTEEERESINREIDDVTDDRHRYDTIQYTLIGIGAFLLLCAIIALLVLLYINHRSSSTRGAESAEDDERQPLLH